MEMGTTMVCVWFQGGERDVRSRYRVQRVGVSWEVGRGRGGVVGGADWVDMTLRGTLLEG